MESPGGPSVLRDLQPSLPEFQLRTVQDLEDTVRPCNANMPKVSNAGHHRASEQETLIPMARIVLTTKVLLPSKPYDQASWDSTQETRAPSSKA